MTDDGDQIGNLSDPTALEGCHELLTTAHCRSVHTVPLQFLPLMVDSDTGTIQMEPAAPELLPCHAPKSLHPIHHL